MTRKTFLTLAAFIALAVGTFAFTCPATLLDSKGVIPNDGANVWVREVGILLISVGVVAALIRGHEDSPTLQAFFLGNIILQMGLIPIELIAYGHGVITKPSGIMPNTIIHFFLAAGFAYYYLQMKKAGSNKTA